VRIAISGASCTGKSTTIRHFLQRWTNYSLVESKYRLLTKENKHSKETTAPLQKKILDLLCEECKDFTPSQKVIFDRCPLDNLVYTMWAYGKNIKGFDDNFMEYTLFKVRESMKFFDILFICTRDMMPKIEDNGIRETDEEYINEIDNIFKAILGKYTKGLEKLPFFEENDAPAIIDIYGQPFERMAQIALYVTEDGNAFGEDQSLLDINELAKMNEILADQQDAMNLEESLKIIKKA
jgi:hypothetical protein